MNEEEGGRGAVDIGEEDWGGFGRELKESWNGEC